MKTVLILGATGAQGKAITNFLSQTGEYTVLAYTRSPDSPHALELAALPNVKPVSSGASSGYDIEAFTSAAKQADYVIVNTDGFAIGEIAETYWGIRLFQLAERAGVKHLIYSGLDSVGKETNYDPSLYVGHYEGKARVQDWMHAQKDSKMKWTIIKSGPYIQQLYNVQAPSPAEDGTFVFHTPLKSGSIPFINLDDFGGYVHWTFSHPEESNHLDFGIATAHVSGPDIPAAFTAVTGKPAKWDDIALEKWNELAWKRLPHGGATKIAFLGVKDETMLPLTYEQNFTNWWHLYQASGDNKGLIKRDYEFLDRIFPQRVKSLEEWMRNVNYTGEKKEILNRHAAKY